MYYSAFVIIVLISHFMEFKKKIEGICSLFGHQHLFLYALLLTLASCVHGLDKKESEEEEDPIVPVDKIEDLKIKSLSLRPEENEFIYGKVAFTPNSDSTKWIAEIENYQADLSKLKIVFTVAANSVTVNDVKQESGVTANNFTHEVIFRLHANNGKYKDFTLSVTNPSDSYSGFPVLAIMTQDEKAIDSKEVWVKGRVVFDPQQGDYELYSGAMEIKGRGHNTWGQPKKPYNMKLSEKTPLMGMNKHKRWVLLANAGDKTLLRNRVAYHLGRLTQLPWTPDTRYVDVILNGKFVGNYLLTEQIRVDKKRVNITDAEAGMTPEQVGYLLEFDRYAEENYFYTQRRQLPVNIKNPDEDLLTQEQKTYISDYINRVEGLLYDTEAVDVTYRDLIDIDTFIDWWIIVELTENRDTKLPGSCYMYKDAGKKLCAGPLWDFDLTTFQGSTREFMQYDYEVDLYDPAYSNRNLWYKRLFSDPVFKTRAKERWNQYKESFETIGKFIDTEKNAITTSAVHNWKIWSISAGSNKDELLSWEEAVERLKTNYATRLSWLGRQIEQW